MSIGSSSSTDTAPAPPLLPVAWQNIAPGAPARAAAPNHAHCLERETPSRLLPRAPAPSAGRTNIATSPTKHKMSLLHACASMRVTAACANMSVTASATKFDAVKRLTWATMKLITVCRSVRVRVDRDEDLKLASPPFNVTRRDSNVINNGRIVASTRNMTTTSRPLWRIRATR
jgi:hypothetical protein